MAKSEVRSITKHIAVLAFPFGSHSPALLNVIRRLSLAAPNAKFSFFSTAKSNSFVFPQVDGKMENIRPYNVADGLPENFVFSGKPEEPVEYFLKATPENFKSALELAATEMGGEVTCIVADAFLWFAADLAGELHVPWVPVWTSASHALLLHAETDLIRQQKGFHGQEDTTLDFLPGFSSIRFCDLVEGIISGNLSSPFSTMLYKMGLMLHRAAAVVSNSFEELEPAPVNLLKSRFNKFLSVGPPVLTSPPEFSDPQGSLDWLDKQRERSVVYVSFGTMSIPPPHELSAFAEALELSGNPFLWSFRGDLEESLPKGFLERTGERGKLITWAPQLNVLQHKSTAVFVTHGGWNSVVESIVSRVPMISRPLFGDHKLNTRCVEAIWGIGVEFEGGIITKEGTMKALERTLSKDEGKNMRTKLEALRELALDAVGSEGSSTQNFNALVEVVTKQYVKCPSE